MALLTTTGLLTRRYPEILELIQNAMKENVSDSLIFDNDTVLGQITQILATEFAAMEEMLQLLNDSMDRDKAEGAALDSLLYLIGLVRQPASRSTGFVEFITNPDVNIPTGTITLNPSSGDRFFSTTPILASPASCKSVWFEPVVQNSTVYTITLNGADYSYTSDSSATALEIVSGLASVIDSTGPAGTAAQIEIIAGKHYVRISSTTDDNISTSVVERLEPGRIKVSVPFESEFEGSINVPVSTVTTLVSGLGGVISLTNEKRFGVGRLRESDSEFRLRATQELAMSGSATYSAIYTALSNLPEVSNLVLLENNTDTTDVNGLPPHSFEAIIDIPDSAENDQLIGQTLWNEKPVGIASYGAESVVIVDDNDQLRTLYFSRPEDKHMAIRVSYELYDEELPPSTLSDLIKDAVISYGSTLTSGKDVIPSRFIGPIYNSTGSGLDSVVVEAQILPSIDAVPDPLDWVSTRISIAPREVAAFRKSNIYVVAL